MTVITKYQPYFSQLVDYHSNPIEDRPKVLRGTVFLLTTHHPDPFTRGLLAHFYAKEVLRNGPQSQNHR